MHIKLRQWQKWRNRKVNLEINCDRHKKESTHIGWQKVTTAKRKEEEGGGKTRPVTSERKLEQHEHFEL